MAIVCFPETYIPGLRGQDFPVPPPDQPRQEAALESIRAGARRRSVSVVMGMEWQTAAGIHNVAFVLERDGRVQGYQAKNQLPLEEEPFYVPDGRRQMFEVDGVPSASPSATRDGAIRRPSGGPPSAAPAWSSTPAHGQRPHRREDRALGDPTSPTTRRR